MFTKKTVVLSLILLVFLVNILGAQEKKQVTFTGKVVDAQGKPVAGAKVKLYGEDFSQADYSYIIANETETTSNDNGEFTFNVNTEGDDYPYSYIVVNKEGLAMNCVGWYMNENKEFEFKLGQTKELSGLIVDENGDSIKDAIVSIIYLRIGDDSVQQRTLSTRISTKIFNTNTNAEGNFSFSNLPAEANIELLVQKKAGLP